MKTNEFKKEWARDEDRLTLVNEVLFAEHWHGHGTGLGQEFSIQEAQERDPKRYTEKLVEVCGVRVQSIEDGVYEEMEFFELEDVEKIANATPEQRLKAAGLTGCDDAN